MLNTVQRAQCYGKSMGLGSLQKRTWSFHSISTVSGRQWGPETFIWQHLDSVGRCRTQRD